MKARRMGVLAVLMCLAVPAKAQGPSDPVAVADALGAALAAGDEAAVKRLLAPDVLIYESGGQESSWAEYAAHHLKADIAFLAGKQQQVLGRSHGVGADLAWVATRTRLRGEHKGKPLDLESTETLVLRKGAEGWRVAHIQWSSRPAPGASGP